MWASAEMVRLFPEPDSPTMPTRSPRRTDQVDPAHELAPIVAVAGEDAQVLHTEHHVLRQLALRGLRRRCVVDLGGGCSTPAAVAGETVAASGPGSSPRPAGREAPRASRRAAEADPGGDDRHGRADRGPGRGVDVLHRLGDHPAPVVLGGCTPMPRKERAAIIIRLAPMVTTVSVTIGSATLGTM